MSTVKEAVAKGVPIAKAIRGALLAKGLEVQQFADNYDLPRASTSQAINGTLRATEKQIAALIAELGGSTEEWEHLLWLAGKPDSVVLDKRAAAGAR